MVLAGNNQTDIGWKKWLIAGWAFLECLLFGGVVYGWGSIVFVLKTEGIYAELCPENEIAAGIVQNPECASSNGTCGNNSVSDGDVISDANDASREQCAAQDSKMTLCFTIASSLMCVGSVVLGHIAYKYGTRVTRLISFVAYVAGMVCMAFISKELPWLMFPGLSLIGTGGLQILVTNIQVSNLFLVGSSTVVGLISGAFDMSSAVLLIVKISHENGFSRRNSLLLISLLHCMMLVSTFLFLPKDFIPRRTQSPDTDVTVGDDTKDAAAVEKCSQDIVVKEVTSTPKSDKPTIKSCLKNPVFILYNVWLYLLVLRWYYFIGTLNPYLNRLLNGDDDKVSYFTNVCYSTMMGGLVSSFFTGIMYDMAKKRCKDGKTKAFRELLPASAPLATTSLLASVLSILVMIPNEAVLYLTFIVLTIMRSFLYAMATCFLIAIYPIEYVGLLYGLSMLGAGIFGFFQYAIFKWMDSYEDAELHSNIVLLVLTLLSLVQPLYLCISSLREEKNSKCFPKDS